MATADFRGQQERMRTTTTPTAPSSAATAVSTGDGITAAVCGLATLGLAIAGLAHAWPLVLAGIAEIVFGFGLICADGAAFTYFTQLRDRRGTRTETGFVPGVGAEAIGGLAGLVLGILTLCGVAPLTLTAVSVIVFGGTVIFGGLSRARIAMQTVNRSVWTEADEFENLQRAHTAAIGARGLVGMAAVVLGIISVCAVITAPLTSLVLALIGLLCLGSGMLLSGSALGSQAYVASNR